MRTIPRRQALTTLAASGAALLGSGILRSFGESSPSPARSRLGIASNALDVHQRNHWAGRHAGLSPVLALLDEGHELGAAGIQCPLGLRETAEAFALRRRAESHGMYVEASLNPPRSEADVTRFEQEVRLAKEAGARVGRTVIMPGRRYEQFKALAEFREAEAQGLNSLQWAEPVLARHRFRLAVENHKDQLVAEKLATLKRLSSEYVGLCVDVGNNLALMEEPLAVVRAFAPWAFTVHLKDHLVREYADGFLLMDVALGDGILNLPVMIRLLREAKPDLSFGYETITRDALRVPVLTDGYWNTFPDRSAPEFARSWRWLRDRSSPEPLVTVAKLAEADQMALERSQLKRSLEYARDKLGL